MFHISKNTYVNSKDKFIKTIEINIKTVHCILNSKHSKENKNLMQLNLKCISTINLEVKEKQIRSSYALLKRQKLG